MTNLEQSSLSALTFQSADPADQPELHLNYLDDREDVRLSMEMTRLSYELAR